MKGRMYNGSVEGRFASGWDSWEGEEGEWNDVQRKQLTFRVRSCLVCTQKKKLKSNTLELGSMTLSISLSLPRMQPSSKIFSPLFILPKLSVSMHGYFLNFSAFSDHAHAHIYT